MFKRNSGWNFGIAGVLLLVSLGIGGFAGCSRSPRNPLIPPKLGDLKLQKKWLGEQATEMVMKLHGKTVRPAPSLNAVAIYGEERPPNTLYVSVYSTVELAKEALQRMADRIGPGAYGFSHHGKFTVQSLPVHFVLGHGQVHFFFARGARLYWLAVDATKAQAALADLLGVKTEKVPSPREFLTAYFQQYLRERGQLPPERH
ncbi:MAG TPA: hypothetical protein ENJ23_04510 [Bacteroidetes bacterium]|nr:hypothetical protein [Bacteroidota bacterium]